MGRTLPLNLVRRLRDQDCHAKHLGRALQPARHVHVRAEVARVDLALRPDRALDRPPEVEPEAQPHREPRDPVLDLAARGELEELFVARELDDDAD
eukprot:3638106-Rhodomonas_salina.3